MSDEPDNNETGSLRHSDDDGSESSYESYFRSTPMGRAIHRRDIEAVKTLVASNSDGDDNALDDTHEYVYSAVRASFWEAVHVLLEAFPECCESAWDSEGTSPIHIAVKLRAPHEELDYLWQICGRISDSLLEQLKHGKDDEGRTPLMIACEMEDMDTVQYLLGEDSTEYLFEAVQSGSLRVLKLAVERAKKLRDERTRKSSGPGGGPAIRRSHKNKIEERLPPVCNLLIHAALLGKKLPPLEVFQYLIESFPEGLHECNVFQMRSYRDLPIHVAAWNGAPLSVVKLLVDACRDRYPDILQEGGEDGYTPLHYAARRSGADDVFQLLVDEDSKALSISERRKGRLPLHLCRRLEKVKTAFTGYPDAIKVQDYDGNLPIHLAASREKCDYAIDENAIQFLAKAYPQGLETMNRKGNFPIHEVLANFVTSNDAVGALALIENQPSCLNTKNQEGLTPAMIVLDKHTHSRLEMLRILVDKDPSCIRTTGTKGMSTLHRFIDQSNGKHYDAYYMSTVLDVLIGKGDGSTPSCASLRDDYGRLPLHMACRMNAAHSNEDTANQAISKLLSVNPQGANKTDREGNLPLFLAAEACRDVSILMTLLKHTLGIFERNRVGEQHIGRRGRSMKRKRGDYR